MRALLILIVLSSAACHQHQDCGVAPRLDPTPMAYRYADEYHRQYVNWKTQDIQWQACKDGR